MKLPGLNLLNSLKNAQWIVAANTYGNNHATLIGLLVNWWITLAPKTHQVLESGPSFGHLKGGGFCDAIFCKDRDAVGILEVEGTRGKWAAEKIGKFFAAEYDSLKTLKFAILLLYACTPKGRGSKRVMPPARDKETCEEVARVSRKYAEKPIIVITLDKTYQRQTKGIRARREYYWSELRSVKGFLYEGGKETASCTFHNDKHNSREL